MKLTLFSVFRNKAVGDIFKPNGFFCSPKMFVPTIMHGRSVAVYVSDFDWILVKGGGWNWKGPEIYMSRKDEELIFGLCPLSAAERELEVSHVLEKISHDFPKVLYYKKICDYELPKELDFLKTIRYSNGRLVEPCLLYTKVKSPYRVADLSYLSDKEKKKIIKKYSDYWGVDTNQFVKRFAHELGKNVGLLHVNNCINDTLEFSNVTLLAEVVDYELITVPNVLHLDGSDGYEIPNERKEKEILYAAEVTYQLAALLHHKTSFFDCYSHVCESYGKYNPSFIKNNDYILRILNNEKYVV